MSTYPEGKSLEGVESVLFNPLTRHVMYTAASKKRPRFHADCEPAIIFISQCDLQREAGFREPLVDGLPPPSPLLCWSGARPDFGKGAEGCAMGGGSGEEPYILPRSPASTTSAGLSCWSPGGGGLSTLPYLPPSHFLGRNGD